MYSTAMCPYCTQAERLLAAKGVTSIDKVRVDLEPQRRQEMMARTGRRSIAPGVSTRCSSDRGTPRRAPIAGRGGRV